jgi:hypothetical protein
METSLVPPSIDAAQNPVPITSLYDLLTRVQSGQKGLPSQYWHFNSRTKKLVAGPFDTKAQLQRSPKVKALKPLKELPAKTAKGKKVAAKTPLVTTPGTRPASSR